MKYPDAEYSTIPTACSRVFQGNHSQFTVAASKQAGYVREHFSSPWVLMAFKLLKYSVHLEEISSLRTQGSQEVPTSSMRGPTRAQHNPSVADFQHVQNICPISYPSPPRTSCCTNSCSCTQGTRVIASVIRHLSAATHDACRGCATSLWWSSLRCFGLEPLYTTLKEWRKAFLKGKWLGRSSVATQASTWLRCWQIRSTLKGHLKISTSWTMSHNISEKSAGRRLCFHKSTGGNAISSSRTFQKKGKADWREETPCITDCSLW